MTEIFKLDVNKGGGASARLLVFNASNSSPPALNGESEKRRNVILGSAEKTLALKVPESSAAKEVEELESGKKNSVEQALVNQFSFDTDKSQLKIAKDQETGRFIYKTVDRESGEVIRQFPADEILKLLRSVKSEAGFLVDNLV